MGKIVLLDELTINQIAAGEVIERPASVVKEMVENSIDAGSKNIVIEIKKGGIDLIKITDDGCGISKDDMEIAFERHATSKIRSSLDLENVKTMGFRGEALASIAAIARVEMISKTAESEIGNRIVIEGGDVKEQTEIGCQKGTTISVENLFYNTPVRYKFLRKDYTESGYIEDVITRLALINKNVAIKLINSGKTVLQTSGNGDTKSVIYSIYGKDVANGIIDIEYFYENIKITGVIGKTEIARGNRGYQLFFVNGRYVKDKNLTAGADGAYKDILPIGKYGFLVLNVEIDPKEVDVNVHPAKLEVRFENESLMYKAIYNAIKSGLDKANVSYNSNELKVGFEGRKNVESLIPNKSFDTVNTCFKKSEMKWTGNYFETPPIKDEEKVEVSIEENTIKESDIESETVESKTDVEKKYLQIEAEENFVQPKIRTGFSELLKKVVGNKENKREEYKEENLVEYLFEARNGKKRITSDFSEFNKDIEEPIKNDFIEAKSEDVKNKIFTANLESDMPIDKNMSFSFNDTDFNSLTNFKTPKKENEIENKTFDFEKINKVENSVCENKIENVVEEKLESNLEKFNNITNTIDNKEQNIDFSIKEKNKEITKEDEEFFENSESGKTIKFGNVSISSDTAELDMNIDDLKKYDFGIEKQIDNIAKEAIEENEKNEVSKDDNEFIKEEEKNIEKIEEDEFNKLEDSIVKRKIDKSFVPTQFVDTAKIRDNLSYEENKEITPEFAEMYKKTFGKDISKKPKENTDNLTSYNEFLYNNFTDNLNVFEEETSYIPERKYVYIGNVFTSYMIIEMGNEMYIIDQRLAYERIIYERLKESYYNDQRRDSQILLLPDIINLNKKQLAIANENIEMFEKAGFGFEEFGENTVKLFAVPGLCEKLNTKQLFVEILDGLDCVSIISKEEKEDKFISTIAYKSATKAKINLDDNEIADVLNRLLSLNNPFICADNKPIAIKMSKTDFEKKFSRR